MSNHDNDKKPAITLPFASEMLTIKIPFHSSSTQLPKQTFKKSKNVAHVIKIQRVTGFDILNSFTNERASHESGQSCQVFLCARAPVKD